MHTVIIINQRQLVLTNVLLTAGPAANGFSLIPTLDTLLGLQVHKSLKHVTWIKMLIAHSRVSLFHRVSAALLADAVGRDACLVSEGTVAAAVDSAPPKSMLKCSLAVS